MGKASVSALPKLQPKRGCCSRLVSRLEQVKNSSQDSQLPPPLPNLRWLFGDSSRSSAQGLPIIPSRMKCIFVLSTSLGTFKRKVGKYAQVKQKYHPHLQEDGRLGKTHAQHILRYHEGDPSIQRNRISSLPLRNRCVAGLLLGRLAVRDPALTTVTPPHEVPKYTRYLSREEPSNPTLIAGLRPHIQCIDLAS